jgi:hypothetical protein
LRNCSPGPKVLSPWPRRSDHSSAAQPYSREARQILETLAKIRGELDERPTTTVNIFTNPTIIALQRILDEELAPVSEIRYVIAARLAELEEGP